MALYSNIHHETWFAFTTRQINYRRKSIQSRGAKNPSENLDGNELTGFDDTIEFYEIVLWDQK